VGVALFVEMIESQDLALSKLIGGKFPGLRPLYHMPLPVTDPRKFLQTFSRLGSS
jgi:hypothetical protein